LIRDGGEPWLAEPTLSFYLYELAYAGERYMLATAIEKGSNGDQGCGIRSVSSAETVGRGSPLEIRMFSQPEGEPWHISETEIV